MSACRAMSRVGGRAVSRRGGWQNNEQVGCTGGRAVSRVGGCGRVVSRNVGWQSNEQDWCTSGRGVSRVGGWQTGEQKGWVAEYEQDVWVAEQ